MSSKQIYHKKRYMTHSCAYTFLAISLLIAYVLFAIRQNVFLIPAFAFLTGLVTTLARDLFASLITRSRPLGIIILMAVFAICCLAFLYINYTKVTNGISPELNLYVGFGPALGGCIWTAIMHKVEFT